MSETIRGMKEPYVTVARRVRLNDSDMVVYKNGIHKEGVVGSDYVYHMGVKSANRSLVKQDEEYKKPEIKSYLQNFERYSSTNVIVDITVVFGFFATLLAPSDSFLVIFSISMFMVLFVTMVQAIAQNKSNNHEEIENVTTNKNNHKEFRKLITVNADKWYIDNNSVINNENDTRTISGRLFDEYIDNHIAVKTIERSFKVKKNWLRKYSEGEHSEYLSAMMLQQLLKRLSPEHKQDFAERFESAADYYDDDIESFNDWLKVFVEVCIFDSELKYSSFPMKLESALQIREILYSNVKKKIDNVLEERDIETAAANERKKVYRDMVDEHEQYYVEEYRMKNLGIAERIMKELETESDE